MPDTSQIMIYAICIPISQGKFSKVSWKPEIKTRIKKKQQQKKKGKPKQHTHIGMKQRLLEPDLARDSMRFKVCFHFHRPSSHLVPWTKSPLPTGLIHMNSIDHLLERLKMSLHSYMFRYNSKTNVYKNFQQNRAWHLLHSINIPSRMFI